MCVVHTQGRGQQLHRPANIERGGGRDRGSMVQWQKEGGGEGTLAPNRLVSVTVQVAISRRVSRFKLHILQLIRDRQDEILKGAGGVTDLHRWRGDGAWMRRKN